MSFEKKMHLTFTIIYAAVKEYLMLEGDNTISPTAIEVAIVMQSCGTNIVNIAISVFA